MKNSISVQGLCKKYDAFSLENISFHLPTGYVMGLIGENGAGKTTTLKSMLGMVGFDSGEIQILGTDIRQDSLFKENVGVVMDLPFFVGDWTVQNVEAALAPFYSKWDKNEFKKLCNYFAIPLDRKVKELSRGMKMKLMLATALCHDAKLLILDEATSGLDPAVKDEILEYLRGYMLDEEHSILLSTHITSDLEKLADYITYIHNGKIFYTGTKDALLDQYVLVKGEHVDPLGKQEEHLIGKRETAVGFSALLPKQYMHSLPKEILIEPVTLEDIMIYHSERRSLHEMD